VRGAPYRVCVGAEGGAFSTVADETRASGARRHVFGMHAIQRLLGNLRESACV